MNRSEAWKVVIEGGSDVASKEFKLLTSSYRNKIHSAYRYVFLDIVATEVYPNIMKQRAGKTLHLSLARFLYQNFFGKSLSSNLLAYLATQDVASWELNENGKKDKPLFHAFRDCFVEDWVTDLLDLEKIVSKIKRGNYDGDDRSGSSSTIRKSYAIWDKGFGEHIESFSENLAFLREKAFENSQKKLWLKSRTSVQNYREIDDLIEKEYGYFENIYFSKSKRNQEAIEKTFIKYFDDTYARNWLPIGRSYHFGTLQMRQQQLLMVSIRLPNNHNVILATNLATHNVIGWYEAVTQDASLSKLVNQLGISAESKNTYIIFFVAVSDLDDQTERFLNYWNGKNTTRVSEETIKHLLINPYYPEVAYPREIEDLVVMHSEQSPIIQFIPTNHGVESKALSEKVKAFFLSNISHMMEGNSLDIMIERIVVSWNQSSKTS